MTLALPSFTGFPFFGENDTPPISTAGLTLWLDANRGVVLDGASQRVAAWTSRFGGLTLTQSTPASMPVLTPNAVNGLSGVTFDGADDNLDLLDLATGLGTTEFLAFQPSSNPTSRNHLRHRTTTGTGDVGISRNNSGGVEAYAGTLRAGGTAALNAVSMVCVQVVAGTSDVVRVNGTPTVATAGDGACTGYRLGRRSDGSSPFLGLIFEAIVYNRTLTTGEILRVENYLKSKWGIA